MNYSLKKISTVEACEALLAPARKKKESLERRRRNLGEAIARFNKRLVCIANELALVQVLLKIFTTAHDTLPEGSKYKAKINVKVKRLEVRQARLDRMSITCNAHSLLRKQVAYNLLDSKVAAIDSYIAAVLRKKVTLGNIAALQYAAQVRLKRHSSKRMQISAAAVSAEKHASKKSVYNSRVHFSGRVVGAPKIAVWKMAAQLSTKFTPYFSSVNSITALRCHCKHDAKRGRSP